MIAGLLFACSSNREATPAKQKDPDPWAGSGSSTLKVPGPAMVARDKPGAEPLAPLRFAIEPTRRTVVFTTSHGDKGQTRPPMSIDLELAWSCEAGGHCHYQLTKFDMRDMPPDPVMDKQMATVIQGTAGDVEVKPDGTSLIQPTSLMKTTPSTTELLRLALVQFPAEPIGIGGTWIHDESDLRRSYELVARSATEIKLSFELTYKSDQLAKGRGELVLSPGDPLAHQLRMTQDSELTLGSDVITSTTDIVMR